LSNSLQNVLTERRPHVINNSRNDEWYTPPEIIEVARRVMGEIDLDPASSAIANEIVKAKRFYSIVDDGLTKKWFGRVWLNPPYSRTLIRSFTELAVEKYQSREIDEAFVLVNNATETRWCQNLLQNAECLCLINGRVKFYDDRRVQAKSPLQGQCLFYFGDNIQAFSRECANIGQVTFLNQGLV
jgi:phage N-6-adenine-methyltransferase